MSSYGGGVRASAHFVFAVLVGLLASVILAHSATATSVAGGPEQVCTELMDVVILVDESGSIGQSNFFKVRTFVSDLILSLPISKDGVHVALVLFGSRSRLIWNFMDKRASDKAAASKSALALDYGRGLTSTAEALDDGYKLLYEKGKGAREEVPKLVILMTDGASTDHAKTMVSAEKHRNKGTKMVILGVGSNVYAPECLKILGCGTSKCPNFIQTNWNQVVEQVKGVMVAACMDLPKDAVCGEWSDYGPCEGKCGEQGRRRSRRVEVSPPLAGTPTCPGCPAPMGRSCAQQEGGIEREQPCAMPVCVVNAGCGDFGPWSEWSATCGKAHRKRVRNRYNEPPASGGGLSCAEQKPPKAKVETENTELVPCPVQQKPGPWGEWSECSKTCGGGTQTREREGIPQEGELYGGQNLEQQGIAVREKRSCAENPCPVDATCGSWGSWTECSKTCGGGSQVRLREPWLQNAQHGGRTCEQQHPEGKKQLKTCNEHPCPIDEVVGDWAEWGPCSEECGPGSQTRGRMESKQVAMYGGKTVAELNESLPEGQKIETSQTRACENNPCGPCTLPWTDWSPCPKCGGYRVRHTMVAFDFHNGACTLPTNQVEKCEGHCPPGGGGGGSGGGGGGSGGGDGREDSEREEGTGGNTAAIAGGIVGGLVVLGAAGGGAAYGMRGAGASGGPEAMEVAEREAIDSDVIEEERETLVGASDQAEMWAA